MSKRPKWWLNFLALVWPLTWLSGRVYSLPIVGWMLKYLTLPLFSKKRQNLTYIPVNEELETAGSSYLPREIVTELIRRSSHRAIINKCVCRLEQGCVEHPIDYGCTLLGDGAKEISPNIARHVSVDEAIGHLDRTLSDGLIPLVGRAPIDNFLYGVSFKGRLLTICHCCRCCCTIMKSGKYLPEAIHESLVPLGGIKLITDHDKCNLCGKCVQECFMGALAICNGMLVRDELRCKACGVCVSVCKDNAVRVIADDTDSIVSLFLERISSKVDFE